MTDYIYILSFVLIFAKIVIPVYLLFRLFFIIKPLFVNLYFEEKFNYYVGINKNRLLILLSLFFLSTFIGISLSKEILNTSNAYNYTFYLFILILIQFVIVYLFEMKTPVSIFKTVKECAQNPKEIFKQRKIVFEENKIVQSINQNGVNFKDAVNLTNGDIIKLVHRIEFDLITEKYIAIFQDSSSIENLYKLCNGIEIKERSILLKIDNKRKSKQNIVEILTSLFNIQKNWNSQIKDRTNTKIVDFLNKYIIINGAIKTLHSNDFTRLFEKIA